MSKTIEEIKEEYFKEIGFKSLDDAVMEIAIGMSKIGSASVLENHFTEIAERYAKSQTQELQEQNAELVNVIKDLIPMAEDGYRLHKNNGSHQDFLEDDRGILKKAKELLTKHNHLKKKP